jgi:hypothetical protein
MNTVSSISEMCAFLAWRMFLPEKPGMTYTAEPNLKLALLLAVPISIAAGMLGVGPGFLPGDASRAYTAGLVEFEQRLLGKTFLETRRIVRWPLRRIALGDWHEDKSGLAPDHADVYLLSHKSGVALWEIWIPGKAQPFDTSRWIGWLDAEAEDSLVIKR